MKLKPFIMSDGFTSLVSDKDFGEELLSCISSLLPNIDALSLTDNFKVSELYTIPLSVFSVFSSVLTSIVPAENFQFEQLMHSTLGKIFTRRHIFFSSFS